MNLVPGQWWQRVLALLFGAGTAFLFLKRSTYGIPAFLAWISFVLFFLFALLSFPPLYRRWLVVAEYVNVWVTRALFSLVYVFFVPFVWILYGLNRPKVDQSQGKSLWISKRVHDRSLEELERMG